MEMRCDQVIIISVSNECRAGSCSAHNVLEFALPRKNVYKNCEFVHWYRLNQIARLSPCRRLDIQLFKPPATCFLRLVGDDWVSPYVTTFANG
jgi:hypothetical protein